MSAKNRADQELVKRGLAESREKAQTLIMAGLVYRGEEKVFKSSDDIKDTDVLTVRGAAHPYVSRGGLKLEKALKVFPVSAKDRVCMDLGASTGGFTDVLLRSGARRVYAVDVGFGQLDWKIRSDERVTVMERTNARYLTPASFPEKVTLGVMDVSFISIRLILPAAFEILGEEGEMISLIKPQFEAGRERVGKKGVVSDPDVHFDVIRQVLDSLPALNWHAEGLDFSPITGPEGNIEFLCYMKSGDKPPIPDEEIRAVVRKAHEGLR